MHGACCSAYDRVGRELGAWWRLDLSAEGGAGNQRQQQDGLANYISAHREWNSHRLSPLHKRGGNKAKPAPVPCESQSVMDRCPRPDSPGHNPICLRYVGWRLSLPKVEGAG